MYADYDPEPADLIFCQSYSLLGKLIRYFTTRPGETETFANHVIGLVSSGYAIEALVTTVKRPFNVNTEKDAIEIYRYTGPIPCDFPKDVVDKAYDYLGRTYGFGKIITHMLDAIIVKIIKKEVFFFRKINHFDRYPICSWIWAFAYYRASEGQLNFGMPPEYAAPDDMHDYVRISDEWKLVYKG